ncbi:hypothetical protein ACHWQZ_G001585 [Mnemiopsis leidyi]
MKHLMMTLVLMTAVYSEPKIVFRYTNSYEFIYNDEGTKGDNYMGLWRTIIFQKGYCALGDVHSSDTKYAVPEKLTLLVKWTGDAVVHPTSFTSVWADHGSGGKYEVEVYRMNAPAGYTCLGGAAMGTYDKDPDAEHYCCIKNDYLVDGQYQKLYDDKGTGAYDALSLWEVLPGPVASGVEAGVFVPTENRDGSKYVEPSEKPYLLNHDHDHVEVIWNVENPPKMPLDVYEVTGQLEHVWKDRGSGAPGYLAIFRATSDPENGFYSVSDVAVPYWDNNNMGFLIKTTKNHSEAFVAPISYNMVYSLDSADEYLRVFRPTCPSDYISLGFVATATESTDPPPAGKIYCIHSDYVAYGDKNKNFKRVWRNDKVPGAWIQIFEAVSVKDEEQGLRSMYADQSQDGLPLNPYFLKVGFYNYIAEKPVVKVEMYDIEYDLDHEVKDDSPEEMAVTYVINKSSITQECMREVSFQSSKTTSFSFRNSVSWGISTSVEGDIPFFAKVTTTIEQSVGLEFESGSEYEETRSDSITAKVITPSMRKVMATITGKKYRSNIPYTATVKKTYFDQTTSLSKVSGIFEGVEVSEVEVVYGKDYPLTQEDLESDEDDSIIHEEL